MLLQHVNQVLLPIIPNFLPIIPDYASAKISAYYSKNYASIICQALLIGYHTSSFLMDHELSTAGQEAAARICTFLPQQPCGRVW